ncbi:MAG: FtsK/SpoIIIE domain-containing protein, partial [Ilumatobacteraceae bacterium]
LGGPNAPLAEVLAMYATSLAVSYSADDVHVYAIDLVGRGLGPIADLPHCGAVAVRNEALAMRIIRWLAQQTAQRKLMIAASGSSTVWEHAALTGELPPQLVLMVSGADRMLNADGSASNLLAPLLTLMSEAMGVRIQVVLSGLPKIVAHRLGMNIERRFVFWPGDAGELGTAGVPKTAAAELRIERRAIEPASGRFVQFAQLAEPGVGEGPVIRRLASGLEPALSRPPKQFADVSWPLPWEVVAAGELVAPPHLLAPLPIGIGTDDGEWLWIDAEDDGPVFAVTGPPKSGRSSALMTIARLAAKQGMPVINVTLSRRSPLASSDDPVLAQRIEPHDLAAALSQTPGRVVILLDDLQRLADASCIEAAMEHRQRILMVVSGSPDLLSSRTGVLRSLPNASSGLLLAPTGSLDGSAIGLRRLPAELLSNPRAGRGVLAIAGEAAEIQIPLVSLARV